MARENVMKLKMSMVRRTSLTDMDSLMDTAKAVEAMKIAAEKNGFTFIADVNAAVGTHDFDPDAVQDDDDTSELEPQKDAIKG